MKIPLKTILLACVVVLFAPRGLADEAKTGAVKAKPAAHTAKLVTTTPDELKWVPNPGAPNDVLMAVVRGDSEKGAHSAFHKFKAGFKAPLHTHSSDIQLAVISGTLVTSTEGGPERKLPPGSYEFQPHTVKHTTGCDAASADGCVIFAVSSGKFDLIPAEEKK